MKVGVPCSRLKELIEDATFPCTSEGEAMAVAFGAWLTGAEPTVYMQNSGLGNIVDIVTSLYHPYEVPLPTLLLSIRCKPYHHKPMYDITEALLSLLNYENVHRIIQEE